MNDITGKKPLDLHDEAIIRLLREDGRMHVRTIAERVGLNDATVRSRIRRLEEAGIMRVVARVDLAAAGFPYSCLVGLRTRGRDFDEVSRHLLEIDEVVSVLSVIGRNDLEIQIIARSLDELNTLLATRIPTIPGIMSTESALAMKIYKYVQPWGRFDAESPGQGVLAMTPLDLTEIDHQILDRLTVDARVSNREIARELGLTEGTIRMRLKRLTDEKAIHVTAVTSYDHLPDPLVSYLWIDVDTAHTIAAVAAALANQPEITYVASLVGRADILAITWVRDATQLAQYLHNAIGHLPGIGRIHYELTHQLIKHDYRLTTIVQ